MYSMGEPYWSMQCRRKWAMLRIFLRLPLWITWLWSENELQIAAQIVSFSIAFSDMKHSHMTDAKLQSDNILLQG